MRELIRPLLSERTTLHLGGPALVELQPENEEEAQALPERVRHWGGKPFVIGAGSNLLVRDEEQPLTLIRPCFREGPEIVGEEGDRVLVRAEAAVPLPRLLRFCAAQGLGGLEGLVGIPGSVGGAVSMNAGSFGAETCRCLHSLRVCIDGELEEVPGIAINYGYRSCELPLRSTLLPPVILSATFGLTRTQRNVITALLRHNFFKKKSTQPVTAWSAGCVFKNPPGAASAGKLLDEAGFRGRRLGGMAFSSKHANFLINEGKGSAAAALALIDEAAERVRQEFGISLKLEVRIVL